MAEGELEVRILGEKVLTTFPALGEEARTVVVSFQYGRLPPLTVWIPEEEDTPEFRASAIRSKIQEFTQRKTRTLKV